MHSDARTALVLILAVICLGLGVMGLLVFLFHTGHTTIGYNLVSLVAGFMLRHALGSRR